MIIEQEFLPEELQGVFYVDIWKHINFEADELGISEDKLEELRDNDEPEVVEVEIADWRFIRDGNKILLSLDYVLTGERPEWLKNVSEEKWKQIYDEWFWYKSFEIDTFGLRRTKQSLSIFD